MNTIEEVINILSDILDLDQTEINKESYLVRDLDTESIDLLEIAVSLNAKFQKEIVDDQVFLKELRLYLKEADEQNIESVQYLKDKYPHLDDIRIKEIVADIDNGPVLKVKDLVAYIEG